MKIKTQPQIYVISRPWFDDGEFHRFLVDNDLSENMLHNSDGTHAERLIEMSTRLCYQSFESGRDSAAFHLNLLEQAHGSTIEHGNWTLLIVGVSRSFTHEMVRHRAGMAYSQLSQRYVDEADTAFVMPPAIQRLGRWEQDDWEARIKQSLQGYQSAVEQLQAFIKRETPELPARERRKKAREAARSLLPNATETHIAVTGNARAWRHFIEMRTERFAEAEMRRAAYACYLRLKDEAPLLFGDYEEEMVDGSPELKTPYKKV